MKFEYPHFVFESDVAQGLCELGLALGIGVLHTLREGGLSDALTRQSSVSGSHTG